MLNSTTNDELKALIAELPMPGIWARARTKCSGNGDRLMKTREEVSMRFQLQTNEVPRKRRTGSPIWGELLECLKQMVPESSQSVFVPFQTRKEIENARAALKQLVKRRQMDIATAAEYENELPGAKCIGLRIWRTR
jgi:hypothetical protein